MTELDERVWPMFIAQHWLVTRAQVLEAGGTKHQISARVRSGRWQVAEPGVYRLLGPTATWESRLLALVLVGDQGAAASHFAAAHLHRLPGFGAGVPEVSITRGTKLRRADARVHTSTDLDRCRVVEVDGVPATDVGRTVLDLARHLSDARVLRLIEDARRANLLSWSDAVRTLARHARPGRPGVRRLRRVILANAEREEITDSNFELLGLSAISEAGLPTPVLHHQVYDGDRFIAEVDLAYVAFKIAIELDGDVHLDPRVRERDLAKQNDLQLAGWIVLRFSWDRFRLQPDVFVTEIRSAITARAASLAA